VTPKLGSLDDLP